MHVTTEETSSQKWQLEDILERSINEILNNENELAEFFATGGTMNYFVGLYGAGLTHQCLYFEQPHTFEQILFIQTAEPALVGHA